MPLVDTLNGWADAWAIYMWGSLLDTTALLAVVSIVWFAIRRRVPAQLGYCLFLLVVIKPCVPGHISVSGAAAYLSPSYTIEKLEAWALLDIQGNDADDELGSITSSGSMEEILAVEDGGIVRDFADGASTSQLSFSGTLMCGWAVVVFGLLSWFFWSQLQLRRILHGASLVPEDSIDVDVSELAHVSHVNGRVCILSSQAVNSPAIARMFGTCIVLPSGLAHELSAAQLSWVLLHEMAHIRRRDIWVALFQRLVQIVFFWNPAVWLANRVIDQQREYSCDDAAMTVATSSRRECGTAFLCVLERSHAHPSWMVPALGFFSAKHCFRSRLVRILDSNRTVRTRFNVASMTILLLLTALLLPRLQAAPQNADGTLELDQSSVAVAKTIDGESTDSQEVSDSQNVEKSSTDSELDRTSGVETSLKQLGADIKYDDGAVVRVILSDRRLSPQDLALLKELTWSPNKEVEKPPFRVPQLLLGNNRLTDEHLANLAGLTELSSLAIVGEQDFTAKGLESVKTLTHLSDLYLTGADVTDDGLAPIKKLTNLKLLYLMNNPRVSDAGLEHLKGLTKLSVLFLNGTSVTDRGLEHLAEMRNLWTLHLGSTKITDTGLERIKKLVPKMSGGLLLTDTNVTNDGVAHLSELDDLTFLRLEKTKVTDAGLEHLKNLPNLQRLWLSETSTTDRGLSHLADLANLEWLDLSRTQVTDAGLTRLTGLKKLTRLDLKDTQVSDVAVARFKESLPDCKVDQ